MSGPKIMPGAQKELDHFFDIPWCRDQFLHPDAVAVPRLDDKQDGRGSTGKLFSETLNSPSTIYHRIVLYRDPSSATSLKPKLRKKWLPIETCSVFYALGDGVCGFGDICHGGVQATLLGEKMVARDKSWDARPGSEYDCHPRHQSSISSTTTSSQGHPGYLKYGGDIR